MRTRRLGSRAEGREPPCAPARAGGPARARDHRSGTAPDPAHARAEASYRQVAGARGREPDDAGGSTSSGCSCPWAPRPRCGVSASRAAPALRPVRCALDHLAARDPARSKTEGRRTAEEDEVLEGLLQAAAACRCVAQARRKAARAPGGGEDDVGLAAPVVAGHPLHLHVADRDASWPWRCSPPLAVGARGEEMEARLLAQQNPLFRADPRPLESGPGPARHRAARGRARGQPDDRDLSYLLAAEYKKAGRYDDAGASIASLLRTTPTTASPSTTSRTSSSRRGEFPAAIARYKQGDRVEPPDVRSRPPSTTTSRSPTCSGSSTSPPRRRGRRRSAWTAALVAQLRRRSGSTTRATTRSSTWAWLGPGAGRSSRARRRAWRRRTCAGKGASAGGAGARPRCPTASPLSAGGPRRGGLGLGAGAVGRPSRCAA